jgi:hypothetical protein
MLRFRRRRLHLPGLHLAQQVGQRLARFVAKALGQHLDRVHAIDAKPAEVVAQLAPGRERPDLPPVEAAERPHRALAGVARHVAVVQAQLLACLHGLAQGLQPGAHDVVQPQRGRIERQRFRRNARGRRQHREDLAQPRFDVARQRRVDPALREPRRSHERRGLVLREHQRRQLEAHAQPVAHAGFAFDRHALVLQVGHVAVHRALRHLQALREKRGRGEPAPADELHELEEAVGAAHQRVPESFLAKSSTK